jgi:4-hydroxy-tetrahydrodipicolinate synthase
MSDSLLAGSWTALPTPFASGELDLAALERLVELQAAAGSTGVVACGTTGEAATLTRSERSRVVTACVRAAADRLRVLAGVGTNATRTTLQLARDAEAAGADGLLAVTPYYNRPGPDGLRAHYAALAGATALPVVLYNVPSRTGVDLAPDLARELFERHPTVRALKEAADEESRIGEHAGGPPVLCGVEDELPRRLAAGAMGVIGVVGNLAPAAVAEVVRRAGAGDEAGAREAWEPLAPLAEALFAEVNPAPVKAALARLGLLREELRLPLTPVGSPCRARLEEALRTAGLLDGAPPRETGAVLASGSRPA